MKFTVRKSDWHYKWHQYYNFLLNGNPFSDPNLMEDIRWYSRNPDSYYNIKAFYMNEVLRSKDFCTYWQNVLLWPFVRAFINLVLLVVIITLFTLIVLIVPIYKSVGLLALIIGGFILFLGTMYCIVEGIFWVFNKIRKFNELDTDSFLPAAYKSFKNKYCMEIVIGDKND